MSLATLFRKSSRRYDEPHKFLAFCVFVANIFLFLAMFSGPYINSIYLVKVNFASGLETVTFGALGFCWNLSGTFMCSAGGLGYHLELDIPLHTPIELPPIPASVTKALSLHVAAFILTLVSFGIIVCAHFWATYLARWTIAISSFIALFIISSFIADIFLANSVRDAFGQENFVSIGTATWFTFAAFLLIFAGICNMLFPLSQLPSTIRRKSKRDVIAHPFISARDLEATPLSSSGSPTLIRQSLVTITTTSHTAINVKKTGYTNVYDSSGEKHPSKNSYRTETPSKKEDYTASMISSSIPEHPTPAHVRNFVLPGIVISEFPSSPSANSPTPTHSLPPLSPLRRPPSQYAPSSYYTYQSGRSSVQTMQTGGDPIFFTPTLLSRSSTMRSGTIPEGSIVEDTNYSQRSTPDWRTNKTNSRVKRSRLSSFQQPALPHLLASVSTLASIGSLVRRFPGVPAIQPQANGTQYPLSSHRFGGDRFIEGVMSDDEKSLASAIGSSDLERSIRSFRACDVHDKYRSMDLKSHFSD